MFQVLGFEIVAVNYLAAWHVNIYVFFGFDWSENLHEQIAINESASCPSLMRASTCVSITRQW